MSRTSAICSGGDRPLFDGEVHEFLEAAGRDGGGVTAHLEIIVVSGVGCG
ncbi:hypothetical protein [Halorussus sp. MSC15.2]|nr:hypothetical protein [Halorussus sp. MSC15.2]NEU58732.1 hypothetical protein [Halorussus sp. MSC15.2]